MTEGVFSEELGDGFGVRPEPEPEPEPERERDVQPEREREVEPQAEMQGAPAQPLRSNDGIYRREQKRMSEMKARIDEQKQKQDRAKMEDVTFSPRINPRMPVPDAAATMSRTPGANEESKKAETAARVASGYWPVFPTPDRQRGTVGSTAVVPRTGSGKVTACGAGEAPAPKLDRGKAAEVKPRCDPAEYAKKKLAAKQAAERLRAEHKGR